MIQSIASCTPRTSHWCCCLLLVNTVWSNTKGYSSSCWGLGKKIPFYKNSMSVSDISDTSEESMQLSRKIIYCDTTTSTLIDEYMEITDRQCSRSQYAWFKWWCHLFWPHFAGAWAPSRGRQPQWTLSDTTDIHPSFQMITKEFGFSGFIGMVHHPESDFFSLTWWNQLCAFYILIWVYSCMEWDKDLGKETLFVFHMKSRRGGVRCRKWNRKKGGKTRTKVGRDEILSKLNG